MDNYEKISDGTILSECAFFTTLVASCGCISKWRWQNLTTLEIKNGRDWKIYFQDNPPDCTSSGGSGSIITSTGTTTTTVNDAAITGTVVAILTDGGGVITEGFTQVGTLVTLTSGATWGVGQILVILMT